MSDESKQTEEKSAKKPIPFNQNWLIEKMQALGYKSSKAGVCHGIGLTAIQAMRLGKKGMDAFDKLLREFNEIPLEEFKEGLVQRDNQLRSDILAFFDSVELFHQANFYPELFNGITPATKTSQVAPFLRSVEMEKNNDQLIQSDSFSGVYNSDDLKQYFSRLSENATQPVQLLLSSSTHTISVSYDPIQKIWIFIDAEGLETRYIQGDNEIAQKVLSSLSNEENENIIFETQIFSPLRDDIVLWKKSLNDILTITPEKSVAVDGFGASWLHLAARNGDIETIESLLNQGASINHLRFDNTTPLHLAAYYGRTDTVKFLLGHGADIDIKNSNDDTVLDFAILSDHMETVKFLLEKNSNIDEERKNGFTLLYSAAATGNTKIVYLLLKAGAAVDKTVNDFTPLQAAEAYEHTETAALIKNGVSLHTAVQNENIMVVNLLLKYDADVNQLNNDGDSPLYLAALNGDSEMVKLLLEKNPDIDKENSNSFTAFYTAAAKGYTEIVKLLLKSGAAVDKSVNGFTPLQAAKAYDHTEIAQIIRQASLIKELSSHSPKHGASSSSGFFFKNPSMMKKSVKIDHPPCSLEAALHQQRQPASTPLIAF